METWKRCTKIRNILEWTWFLFWQTRMNNNLFSLDTTTRYIVTTHMHGDGKKEKQNEKDLDRMFWECWYSTRIGQESATFTAN